MLTPRRLLGPLLALLVAAGGTLPGQALAQGAGDEQYQDPLAGEQEPPEAGNDESEPPEGGGEEPAQDPAPDPPAPSGPDTSTSSGSGSGSGSAGAADPAPAGAEPDPAAAQGGAASAAPLPSAREAGQLPRTGGDPVLAGVLGAALLAAGTGLRVRVRAADGPR